MNKPKVIVLTGPTAVGKTDLSIKLAKKLNTDIISADSMQIYKNLDIGTAKIKEEEKLGVTHHFIDIIEADENYSVKDYQDNVRRLIKKLNEDNKIAIICGGTGLYINSIIYNLNFDDKSKNEKLRSELYNRYEKYGIKSIRDELKLVDNESYDTYHENDVKRNIRALEYYLCTNNKFSDNQDSFTEINDEIDSLLFVLKKDREKLYQDINRRVDIMIEEGLIDEVEDILKKISPDSQSLEAIGYKEVLDYFNGIYDYETMISKIKQHSRNYAKRQLTWFRKMPNKYEIDITNKDTDNTLDEILDIIKEKWDI